MAVAKVTLNGVTLMDISDTTSTADKILTNYTAYGSDGVKMTGTATSGSAPTLQAKTNVTPTTSSQTITPDSGYDGLSSVQINAMPSGALSNPGISVSSGGLITATSGVGTAGYLATSATASNTQQLTTQAAQIITPGTANQTIPSGRYLTGTQTILGDADLVASNILSTAEIFGVQGSVVIQHYYTGSGAPSASLGVVGDIYLQE